MATELIIQNEITIDASPAVVWNVLVNPEQTKKYMFGCETISDWKAGSELLWRGAYEGKEMIFVKGTILEIDPPKRLVYTTIDPNSNIDDRAENYLWVRYELTDLNGKTNFKVTQGDYAKVAEGQRRYEDSYNGGEGWNPLLVQIKKIAEEN